MGFYFRKSVRVGPLRFNLSKSGIGVSAGIRGLRIGSGPRGNYIHIGQGGFYYRQTLSSPKHDSRPVKHPEIENAQIPSGTHGAMNSVGSDSVIEMSDSTFSALLSEIEAKRRQLSLFPISAIIAGIAVIALLLGQVTLWLTALSICLLSFGVIAAYFYDQWTQSVVLMYDLEGPALTSYEVLFSAIDDMAKCGGIWRLTARGDVYQRKYHAGASHLVERSRLSVGCHAPPNIKTNVSVPCVRFRHHSLYFLPDCILIYASKSVGAIAYSDLTLAISATRFIEDGRVPHDASVVDHTWRFVNKNGGPDRRFSNNRQLPICQYEELRIIAANGINETVQLSRVGLSAQFQSALSQLIQSIRQADVAEQERIALERQRRDRALLETRHTAAQKTTYEQKRSAEQVDVYAAFFDLLCCVMVSDGRASIKEKLLIRDLMAKTGCSWTESAIQDRIAVFIRDVETHGYSKTLERSMAKLPMFHGDARARILALPAEACAGLRNSGHADSVWSYVHSSKQGKSACPPACCITPAVSAATH